MKDKNEEMKLFKKALLKAVVSGYGYKHGKQLLLISFNAIIFGTAFEVGVLASIGLGCIAVQLYSLISDTITSIRTYIAMRDK